MACSRGGNLRWYRALQVTPEIECTATGPVRAAISAVGRTEDVRFSPDNSVLAVAGYTRGVVLLLRACVEPGPRVHLDDFLELSSGALGEAHGVEFVDDRTLAVGNRDGWVAIIPIPAWTGGHQRVAPTAVLRGGKVRSNLFRRLHSPGSLVAADGPGGPELLVCNNYKHRVTRHRLDPARGHRAVSHEILLRRGLEVPDGIAVSPDSRWLAVSSHGTHDVKVYDASASLNRNTEPVATLPGANYPHGLRFTPDGAHLLVADAGAPFVLVYGRGAGWQGTHKPMARLRVMDDATFESTRVNIEEGGPKGLDIDRSGRVVAVSCESVPLRFFSLRSFVEPGDVV